jgi:hypothetical protein
MPVDTSIVVRAVDETTFTFETTRGHMFAGVITCSAGRMASTTYAAMSTEFRTNDPLYDLGFLLGGSAYEDWFWRETLRNLARRLGVEGTVSQTRELRDPNRRWRNAGNVAANAAIRTLANRVVAPLRAFATQSRG